MALPKVPGAERIIPAELLSDAVRGIVIKGGGQAGANAAFSPGDLGTVLTLAATRFRKRLDWNKDGGGLEGPKPLQTSRNICKARRPKSPP